jgi:signal transduction histidine kinase
MQILLVEDNPGDARLLREMLLEELSNNYQIDHVTTLGEALLRLQITPCDLICLDLSLPDAHGYATFERLYDQTPQIPIIVLSGLDDEVLATRAVREGAQDYLVKGQVTPALLMRAIRYAIERKRIEETLKQERVLLTQRVEERTTELVATNRALQHAAQAKNSFLATMSHELRTPLSVMLMGTELLQREAYGPVQPRQLKSLDRIRQSGLHLLRLINDLLDLSKIESGNLHIAMASVDVERVCSSSLQMIQEEAQRKKIQVTHTLDQNITTLLADEGRLSQILINLLNNAVKFTPTEGQIGLIVIGHPREKAVEFTVWDNGIGIAPADQMKLFKPFVQLDHTLQRQHEGSGLGLALVAQLVELHGGRVSLESSLGEGSHFSVFIPWREADPPLVADDENSFTPPSASTLNGSSPLILLADDHESITETIVTALTAAAYRVITARDGAEAIRQTEQHQPDLILMDIQMPTVDGLEAIRRIRTQPTMKATPIIALTALAMAGDRERCLAAGANEYLTKPVSLQQLIRLIATMLNQRRQ